MNSPRRQVLSITCKRIRLATIPLIFKRIFLRPESEWNLNRLIIPSIPLPRHIVIHVRELEIRTSISYIVHKRCGYHFIMPYCLQDSCETDLELHADFLDPLSAQLCPVLRMLPLHSIKQFRYCILCYGIHDIYSQSLSLTSVFRWNIGCCVPIVTFIQLIENQRLLTKVSILLDGSCSLAQECESLLVSLAKKMDLELEVNIM